MNFQLDIATQSDKEVIRNLLELYQYDMVEFSHDGWRDVQFDGRYGYPYLDLYWQEPTRHPFLVKVDGNPAGFVLVNQHLPIPEGAPAKSIAEFFIMRKYRGQGIGKKVAEMTFDRFPGKWQVTQEKNNPSAQKFWRRVIDSYTSGQFQEKILDNDRWNGPVLIFSSSKKA